MQLFLYLGTFLIPAVFLQAAEKLALTNNPGFPDQCFVNETSKAYQVNEKWRSDDECIQYTCTVEDGQYFASVQGCTADALPPCTSIPGNSSAPFPDCCPVVTC